MELRDYKGDLKMTEVHFNPEIQSVVRSDQCCYTEAEKSKTCFTISELCCQAEVVYTPFVYITSIDLNKWLYLLLFDYIILYILEQIRVARI